MPYLLNFILVITYYFIITQIAPNKYKAKKKFVTLVCIHAVLFRALANPYNYVDTEVYAEAFCQISSWSFADVLNPLNFYAEWGQGYVILNWLLSKISTEPQFMFASLSVLSIVPVMWFYFKTSHSILFTIVIYLLYPMFYYMGFGVLRQHLATGFVLLALYYVDKLKYSIPLALLALSFHISVVVFFPFYLWKRLNLNGRNISKSLFMVVVVCVVIRYLFENIMMSFTRYSHYLDSSSSENNIVPVFFLGSVVLMLWINNVYQHISERNESNIAGIILYGFAVSLIGIGMPGMGRTSLYFLYVFPSAITLLDKYSSNVMLIEIYKMGILCFVILLLLMSYDSHPYAYSFFWERVTRTW